VNEINTRMDCELFEYVNITRNNLIVHMFFNESKTFKNEFNMSYYKDDYDEDQITINRTDSDEQYFNMTFAEDFNMM
jgi:hypothetical protein